MNRSVSFTYFCEAKSHRLVAFVVGLLILLIIFFSYIIIFVFACIFFLFWILSGGQKSQDYIKKQQNIYMFSAIYVC